MPKSSLVSTMPRPKSCSQNRLTATRATRRVVLVDQPARQAEPIGGQVVAHRVERGWRAAYRARAVKLPRSRISMRQPLERWPLLHHECRRDLQIGERLARSVERVARVGFSAGAVERKNAELLGFRFFSLRGWKSPAPDEVVPAPRSQPEDPRRSSPRAAICRCPGRWCRQGDRR